jgi:hypothetical protein
MKWPWSKEESLLQRFIDRDFANLAIRVKTLEQAVHAPPIETEEFPPIDLSLQERVSRLESSLENETAIGLKATFAMFQNKFDGKMLEYDTILRQLNSWRSIFENDERRKVYVKIHPDAQSAGEKLAILHHNAESHAHLLDAFRHEYDIRLTGLQARLSKVEDKKGKKHASVS